MDDMKGADVEAALGAMRPGSMIREACELFCDRVQSIAASRAADPRIAILNTPGIPGNLPSMKT